MGCGRGAALLVSYAALDVLANGACRGILAYTMLAQETDVFALASLGQTANRMDLLDVSLVVARHVGREDAVYLGSRGTGGAFNYGWSTFGLGGAGQQKEGKR